MGQKAPGKAHRQGMTLVALFDMVPDEQTAANILAEWRWGEDEVNRHCPRCGGCNTKRTPGKTPYWCKSCRRRFSVRTGTVLERTNIPLRKWVVAIYQCVTNLKGVSSMKLHRDIGVTQKTAWFMLHRIREAWTFQGGEFDGPVEADETYMGGKEKNKHSKKKLRAGRGAVGKMPVAGVKDRATGRVAAKVVSDTTGKTLQGFIKEHTHKDTQVYTDEAAAYKGIDRPHEAVAHSVGEYVREQAHTNGLESFWAMLKRGHEGTFHHISPKHLDRYVKEFAGRHNQRDHDTVDMMQQVMAGMVGKNLMYRELIAV